MINRWLKFHSLKLQRRYPKKDQSLLARMMRSDLVRWNQNIAARGMAIGMFWAFMPIPFQMIPAALFCWLIRGNLPIAILCVWLTNPVTLPPIIYFEYRLGEWIISMFVSLELGTGTNIYSAFTGGLRFVLAGSLFLSCFMMALGYLLMYYTFTISHLPRKRRQRQVNLSADKVTDQDLRQRRRNHDQQITAAQQLQKHLGNKKTPPPAD